MQPRRDHADAATWFEIAVLALHIRPPGAVAGIGSAQMLGQRGDRGTVNRLADIRIDPRPGEVRQAATGVDPLDMPRLGAFQNAMHARVGADTGLDRADIVAVHRPHHPAHIQRALTACRQRQSQSVLDEARLRGIGLTCKQVLAEADLAVRDAPDTWRR